MLIYKSFWGHGTNKQLFLIILKEDVPRPKQFIHLIQTNLLELITLVKGMESWWKVLDMQFQKMKQTQNQKSNLFKPQTLVHNIGQQDWHQIIHMQLLAIQPIDTFGFSIVNQQCHKHSISKLLPVQRHLEDFKFKNLSELNNDCSLIFNLSIIFLYTQYLSNLINKIMNTPKDLPQKQIKFFLINNQLTEKNFQNHPYFSLDNKHFHRDKYSLSQTRQYVNTPASFGVNNIYKFVAQESIFWCNTAKNDKRTNLNNIQPISDRYRKETASTSRRIRIKQFPQTIKVQTRQKELQFKITLIFTQNLQFFHQISDRKIHFNVIKYFINCFLKCKIDFRLLNQLQINEIIRIIKITLKKPQFSKSFSAQDVVNMTKISEVFAYLKQFKEGTFQWTQIVRYFFLSQKKIQQFEMNKLKQQLNKILQMQFGIKINQQYKIFRQNGQIINDLYDFFLVDEIFLFDVSKKCHQQFVRINRDNCQKIQLKNKISKWKSIAPQVESNHIFITGDCNNYKQIQKKSKMRREKLKKNRHRIILPQKQIYIHKYKLQREESLFQ